MIGVAEQPGKQLSAGNKAACSIHCEEYKNKYGRYSENNFLLLMKTVAEKIGHCNSVTGNN